VVVKPSPTPAIAANSKPAGPSPEKLDSSTRNDHAQGASSVADAIAPPANREQKVKEPATVVPIIEPRTSPSDEVVELVHYRLIRARRGAAKKLTFRFFKGEDAIMCAKVIKRSAVRIWNCPDYHAPSAVPIASLDITKRRTVFVLREENIAQRNAMSVTFQATEKGAPRQTSVSFTKPIEGVDQDLAGRKPRKNPDGSWTLDLNGRFALLSVKNCIIADGNDRECLTTLKIASDILKVDALTEIPAVYTFGFGIACFLSSL
jgi:hypothetical protein